MCNFKLREGSFEALLTADLVLMRGEVRELEEDTVEAWRDSEPMEAAASSKAALAWAACCRASVSTYMAA